MTDATREHEKRIAPTLRRVGKRSMPEKDRIAALTIVIDEATKLGLPTVLTAAIASARDLISKDFDTPDRVQLLYELGRAEQALGRLQAAENPDAWMNAHFTRAMSFFERANDENNELVDWRILDPEIYLRLSEIHAESGRIIEALHYSQSASWAARGRKYLADLDYARNLLAYGDSVFIKDYRARIHAYARAHLQSAGKSLDKLSADERQMFDHLTAELEARLKRDGEPLKLPPVPEKLGKTDEADAYIKWVLRRQLYLNPLNDATRSGEASADVLHLPPFPLTTRTGLAPVGLYNILKQEYVSARYTYFHGISQDPHHFSDDNVLLLETVDMPAHAYKIEQIKHAFRAAYALFDRIAYFLNMYLDLKIEDGEVVFRSIWYVDGMPSKGIRPELEGLENPMLRALHDLSRDIFERKRPIPDEGLGPERLDALRNAVEHKFLMLHSLGGGEWREDEMRTHGTPMAHPHGDRVSWMRFSSNTAELLALAREALIYLALAVHIEESKQPHGPGMTTHTLGPFKPEIRELLRGPPP